MGTVIFVILRAAHVFDTSTDWFFGCLLISLDSLAFALFSLGSTIRGCLKPDLVGGKEPETVMGSEDETKTEG